ncbi:MAG: hypothetical protein QOE45_846, partial [Frankiaceae bacterium]|nr:hypothetical protein [Frankiaceae bacterium]
PSGEALTNPSPAEIVAELARSA